MSKKLINILNGVFFYIIWWGCILGIKYSYVYLGLCLTTLLGIIHLNIVPKAKREMKVVFFCGLYGFAIEILYLYSGLLSYQGYLLSNSPFPPLWIICIWVGFSAT